MKQVLAQLIAAAMATSAWAQCTSRWIAPGASFNTDGYGMRIYHGALYTRANSRISSFDGAAWTTLGAQTTIWPNAMEEWDGNLIIGGANGTHIARWDTEAWHDLGTGTNNQVFALAVYN